MCPVVFPKQANLRQTRPLSLSVTSGEPLFAITSPRRGRVPLSATPAPSPTPVRNDELERVLSELTRLTDCRALVVARRDGLMIIHRVPAGRDPAALAAYAAATVDFALNTASSLDQGEFEQVVIKCAEGTILAAAAGPEAVLLGLYDAEADMSLARFRLKRATKVIEDALGHI